MEPFSIGALALAGMGIYRYMKRGQTHSQWAEVLNETAKRVGGKASIGTRYSLPQLRTTIDEVSITISVQNAYRNENNGTVVAETRLPRETEDFRLYFGWNITAVRKELTYIPELELPFTFGLPTPHIVRSSHENFAYSFFARAANDLVDVKREANAHGLELLLRRGGFRIAVHGIERSPWLIERISTATARLTHAITHFAQHPDSEMPMPAVTTGIPLNSSKCTLCEHAHLPDSTWVSCNRCHSQYHQPCWRQATGCIVSDCFETRATPL